LKENKIEIKKALKVLRIHALGLSRTIELFKKEKS
jgi:hypothetical protein